MPHNLFILESPSSLIVFYLWYSNVNSQVEKIKVRHEKFLDLVKNTDTSSNEEFKELRKGRKYSKNIVNLSSLLCYECWLLSMCFCKFHEGNISKCKRSPRTIVKYFNLFNIMTNLFYSCTIKTTSVFTIFNYWAMI